MSGLFSVLRVSGDALGAYTSAMGTIQQNLLNATTPGYARQVPVLVDLGFDPRNGLAGGVRFWGVQDTRDPSVDQTIRFQTSQAQKFETLSGRMNTVVSYLDAGDSSDLSSIMRSFFTMAQGWSASPSDPSQRVAFLNQARLVATTLSDVSKGIEQQRDANNSQIDFTVGKINGLAEQIAGLKDSDALSQASLSSALEQLSELADVTVNRGADGSITVLLGGQIPLVTGGQARTLSVQADTANGNTKILTSQGEDVTNRVSDGQLGAYLNLANQVFPSLIGGKSGVGSLNTLAKTFADKVNESLGGANLFTYDSKNPKTAASSLQVPASWTADNFNPTDAQVQQLAALTASGAGGASLRGLGFGDFYDRIVTEQSLSASSAQSAADRHGALLQQAQSLRSTISGVDTSTEAVDLLQLQQSFQAVTRVMSTVNSLIDSVLDLVK